MQSKSNLAILIATLSLALAFVAAIIIMFGVAIHAVQPAQNVANASPALTTWKSAPIEALPVASPADSVQEVAVADVQEAAPVAAEAVAVTEQPAIPFASDISAVGIAQADQPTVAALLFDGPMWKSEGRYGVQVALQGQSIQARFERVNSYVVNRYGSWAAALVQSQNNGGAW